VDGRLAPGGSQEAAGVKRRRSLALRRPSRNASEVRSRAPERALRGDGPYAMEDTPDGCGNALRSRERDAGDLGGLHGGECRASGVNPMREATGVVRGSVCTRHGGKTTPTATTPTGDNVRPAEANRPERDAGDLLECAGAQALDAPRTNEARVLVRRT